MEDGMCSSGSEEFPYLRHKNCENWRGISLLDVVGKLLERILQDRLQLITEKVLPESQSGFRKGRGCIDKILQLHSCLRRPGNMMSLYLHYLLIFVRHMTLYLERGCGRCYGSMVFPQ